MRQKSGGTYATAIFTPTFLGALLTLFGIPFLGIGMAHAGDGRVEINQARALAGGVSPADSPGFPVTLVGNQSYVLTGDLDAGSSSGLALTGTPGNNIDNVTIDLNGFTLRGNGQGSTSSGIVMTGRTSV